MDNSQHTPGHDLIRSMLSRAGHITHKPYRSSLVTERVGDVFIQCEGRPTFRRTLDGVQPTVSFHWLIDCKRSSKSKVFAALAAATGSTHE